MGKISTLLCVQATVEEEAQLQTNLDCFPEYMLQSDHILTNAIEHIMEEGADAMLLKLDPADEDSIRTLQHTLSLVPHVPTLVFSQISAPEFGLAVVQAGAQDYLTSAQLSSLSLIYRVRYAIERQQRLVQMRQACEREKYMATHDSLTNLPNRQLFYDRLTQAVANAQRREQELAVLFVDLDGFKEVNDTLGHAVGDELLKQVAKRLIDGTRASDTAARLGGDEFTVIVNNLESGTSADKIARKLCHSLAQPYEIEGKQVHVTASVGIASYPKDGEKVQTLINKADLAMYDAKESGRNNVQAYGNVVAA